MPNRRNTLYLLIIACLVTGLFTGRSLFFNIAYLLGGLLFVAFLWAFLSVRWVGLNRRTRSRRAQVGRNFEETFIVQNHAWLPKLWLELRDESELPGHHASHVIPAIGRTPYRWYVDTPCLVRGDYRLGPMTVISGDPFGLYNIERRLASTSRIVVFPQTVPVARFYLPSGTISGGEAEARRTQHVTTNPVGVRSYVPGDSFNRIHWKSTAKTNQLMVKKFEMNPRADIWLFVDFSESSLVDHPTVRRNESGYAMPSASARALPASTEEYAVAIGASLAKYFVESERALGFTAYVPHREVQQPERGSRQLLHILQVLAVARTTTPYRLAQMLSLEQPFLERGTTLVIVTASLDTDWVAGAQILARRGIRTACVLIDPGSFGGAPIPNELRTMLNLAKIPTVIVHNGDDLGLALAQKPF